MVDGRGGGGGGGGQVTHGLGVSLNAFSFDVP